MYNSQDVETTEVSINGWIKMRYICTVEYYPAIKKNETLPFATTWKDLESIMLSESEKKKSFMVSLICGI